MKIFTVDAFTNKPFTGNPAAVCILDNEISDSLMLKIAREINFSETAFIQPGQIRNTYNLRWFTPAGEIDLCGHATLATAKIYYNLGLVNEADKIQFITKSGILTAEKSGDKIALDFPAGQVTTSYVEPGIESMINSTPVEVGMDGAWCLIELENEVAVRNLKPDIEMLKEHDRKLFVVTARSSSPQFDFVSRCFAPALGIIEDPVTGSSHCYLATYWGRKLNKTRLTGFQVSERTGIIECQLIDNHRVLLIGDCVIMSELIQSWEGY
jgi:PhzF family phenazine biosynthesis protein